MQFEEVVEAQGHLIDSHVMEQIFDKVVEYNSRFEVEQFRIGRTNSDASYLRLKVETPSQEVMDHLLQQLLGLGCSPVDSGDAQLRTVERDRCLKNFGDVVPSSPAPGCASSFVGYHLQVQSRSGG